MNFSAVKVLKLIVFASAQCGCFYQSLRVRLVELKMAATVSYENRVKILRYIG